MLTPLNSREILRTTAGHLAPLGPGMTVRRVLPADEIGDVSPFIFLDHMGPVVQRPQPVNPAGGTGAHPHRGFITFTYLFSGEVEHLDSRGHRGTVGPGGAQWMLAGAGIVHDEKPSAAFRRAGGILHGLQLWLNLPAAHKNDAPAYQALPAADVPEVALSAGAGRLRVLVGEYEGLKSPLPVFSPMNVYHLALAPQGAARLPVPETHEALVYVPTGRVRVGGQELAGPGLARLDRRAGAVVLTNPHETTQDVVLLTGQPLDEPVVAHGPFVMNTEAEIRQAYQDFQAGRFGRILI